MTAILYCVGMVKCMGVQTAISTVCFSCTNSGYGGSLQMGREIMPQCHANLTRINLQAALSKIEKNMKEKL